MSEEVKNEAPAVRGNRKTRRGTVVKKSGDKTIVVLLPDTGERYLSVL